MICQEAVVFLLTQEVGFVHQLRVSAVPVSEYELPKIKTGDDAEVLLHVNGSC